MATKRLAVFVEQNMPRVISYGFLLDEYRAQMTVVAVHPDSESLEFHMDTGADEFRNFADLIDFRGSRSTGRSAMACVRSMRSCVFFAATSPLLICATRSARDHAEGAASVADVRAFAAHAAQALPRRPGAAPSLAADGQSGRRGRGGAHRVPTARECPRRFRIVLGRARVG